LNNRSFFWQSDIYLNFLEDVFSSNLFKIFEIRFHLLTTIDLTSCVNLSLKLLFLFTIIFLYWTLVILLYRFSMFLNSQIIKLLASCNIFKTFLFFLFIKLALLLLFKLWSFDHATSITLQFTFFLNSKRVFLNFQIILLTLNTIHIAKRHIAWRIILLLDYILVIILSQ
jgi:hypothetical protein